MIITWLVGSVMLALGVCLGYAMARQGVHVRWPHGLEIHVPTVKDASEMMDKLNAAAADAQQKQVMVSGLVPRTEKVVRQ